MRIKRSATPIIPIAITPIIVMLSILCGFIESAEDRLISAGFPLLRLPGCQLLHLIQPVPLGGSPGAQQHYRSKATGIVFPNPRAVTELAATPCCTM
jgi:hypothetical protein